MATMAWVVWILEKLEARWEQLPAAYRISTVRAVRCSLDPAMNPRLGGWYPAFKRRLNGKFDLFTEEVAMARLGAGQKKSSDRAERLAMARVECLRRLAGRLLEVDLLAPLNDAERLFVVCTAAEIARGTRKA